MLNLAQEERKKTHLMYQSNLCYDQLNYYMEFLLKKGFLEEKNKSQGSLYNITNKGKEFLKNIEIIINQIK